MGYQMINDLFDLINYDIFGNELDQPIFILHYDSTYYGGYIQWEGTDIITLYVDMDFFTGATTLAHEMIHQWQAENSYKLNHGFKFKAMAKQIENFYNLKKGDI